MKPRRTSAFWIAFQSRVTISRREPTRLWTSWAASSTSRRPTLGSVGSASWVNSRRAAIWAWGESYPDLIVNDIGTYDGTTLLPDGSLVLQVDADGTWTISPS